MRTSFLPFARPALGEEEIAEVVDTLKSGWLTTGPKVERFTADFAAYVEGRFAVPVSSATFNPASMQSEITRPAFAFLIAPHSFPAQRREVW